MFFFLTSFDTQYIFPFHSTDPGFFQNPQYDCEMHHFLLPLDICSHFGSSISGSEPPTSAAPSETQPGGCPGSGVPTERFSFTVKTVTNHFAHNVHHFTNTSPTHARVFQVSTPVDPHSMTFTTKKKTEATPLTSPSAAVTVLTTEDDVPAAMSSMLASNSQVSRNTAESLLVEEDDDEALDQLLRLQKPVFDVLGNQSIIGAAEQSSLPVKGKKSSP